MDVRIVANRRFNVIYLAEISLIIIIVCQLKLFSLAGSLKQTISIEDLVSYTRIRNVCLSPDGEWVTYLAIKPQIAANRYHSTLFLQRARPGAAPIEIAQFYTTGDQTFDKDTGELRKFGGQAIWSVDSRMFAYTKRVSDKIQLWLHSLGKEVDVKIAGDFSVAEIVGWGEGNTVIEFKGSSEPDNSRPLSGSPDPALNITDNTNFWAAPWYGKPFPASVFRSYKYNILSRELADADNKRQSERNPNQSIKYEDAKWPTKPDETKYARTPTPSPDGKKLAYLGVGFYNAKDAEKAYRDSFVGIRMVDEITPPKEFHHTSCYITSLKWGDDSKEVYALLRCPEYTSIVAIAADSGAFKELIKTKHSLSNLSWHEDGTGFVAVGQSSLTPDELVWVDLIGKKISVLAAPNASFAEKDTPEVRFMRIDNPLGGGIFGRLILPNGYVKGKLYPLIFTTYRAGTEFLEGAVGNEFPILPFAANGFAVFAMDTGISNMVSTSGDLEFTLMRLRRPLDAMKLVRSRLTEEGIIDPEKCAITGLSYGSDIANYAVANTKIFKAASVSISGLDPIMYQLNSVSRVKLLEEYGYPFPRGIGLEKWKQSSIALNAANIVTPLLIQSSDSEAMFSVEAYKALKYYGAPVDWYVYPEEGHLKHQPLNKYYVYRRNLDWMRFWLKDEVTDGPDRRDQYSKWQAMKEAFRARQLSTEKKIDH